MEQLRCDGTKSLDPVIWSELPYDLLECIASFADIDSRRALGFKPRPLPPLTPPPFRPNGRNEVFKYLTETKTLVYLEFFGYNEYYWDVKTGMRYNQDIDTWSYTLFTSTYHSIYAGQESEGDIFYQAEFQIAGHPEFV